MRIAVTGAAGFVGGAVCRAAVDAGHEVFPFGRREWDLTMGPLADPPSVDVVVHSGAAVTDWGPAEPVRRANVDGTAHVMATFPRARIVHMSSASVYDPFTPTVLAREHEAPVGRYLTPYGETKAAAERLLAGRPNTVILRPHAVYGPGDPTLLPRVLGAIRGRTLIIVGDGTSAQSLTSIDNLVAATMLACDPDAPDGTYNVADAEPVVVRDALGSLLAERGLRVRIRHLPLRVAWPLASAAEWLYRNRAHPPRLTRYAISHLAMERTLDLTAARTHLGYHPSPTTFTGAATW